RTMNSVLLSIVIPTYNRPRLLQRAVKSALEQTIEDLDIVVVDDGSAPPVRLPEHPRLRVIRLPSNRGLATARNVGTEAARGKWIAYLDDDDQLLPHFAEASLNSLAQTTLPTPVAVLSGLQSVTEDGELIRTHLPPTFPRGSHFSLEKIDRGQSFFSKQTLVVERTVILEIGGFDESFGSFTHSEIFLRLNPVCSILGLPVVTYRQVRHAGPRVSRDPYLRQLNFNRFISKHKSLLQSHPRGFADLVYEHARRSYRDRNYRAAICSLGWAIRLHPLHTLGRVTSFF
ncbi:MAG: glycosyltransferase family 2 protein, partial [Pyrinomonadaceae bacterium]